MLARLRETTEQQKKRKEEKQMKNFIKKLFNKQVKSARTSKSARTTNRRMYAGTARNGDELLTLKYDGLKQGYTVSIDTFTSSLGTVHNVYYHR